VPTGDSVQLPFELAVPQQADPGGYDATLALTLTVDGEPFPVTSTTPGWASVTSGLAIGTVSAATDVADPADHAVVTVPVSNTGTADVRAHVALTLPTGWRSVPSSDVLVPAGGQVDVLVPVVVPLDRNSDPITVDVVVARAGATLVERSVSLALALTRPPVGALDHVDFGDTTSENAHALDKSASSGVNSEAGLTRRYSNSGTPGSWFSAEVTVPAGQPFVLRNVETYSGPYTKKYDVSVDGVLVREHVLPRAEGGHGFKVYDFPITDPAALAAAADGKVRVRYEYRLGTNASDGFFDPSIADLWVLPIGADTRGPDVAAVVTGGTLGNEGWYRSDATVEVSAVDSRDAAPILEIADGGTWSAYDGPVAVTGDGKREVSYRATDADANVSTGSLPVWIDATAPVTVLTATRGEGVEGADSATLDLAATDATSGIASTVYRIDGGAWATVGAEPITVNGFGDHMVEFAATDVAGNVEPLRTETVALPDVDTVAAIVSPQVTGGTEVGSTLTATPGSWNTKGLSFGYQWLRGDAPIGGATGTSYQLGAADIGAPISVRVTATKAGLEPGVATSAATTAVVDLIKATAAPQVSGSAEVGSLLTATSGTWNTEGVSFAYQWLRADAPIGGATGTSYQLGVDDIGARISVRVTATKAGQQPGTATSTATAPVVDLIKVVVVPQVAGTAAAGSLLTATSGTWNTEGVSFGYQWLRGDAPIGGATDASYRLVAADIGARISVRVTATKAGQQPGVATSSATAPVVDLIKVLVAPEVTGSAVVGSTLTATSGTWNTEGVSIAYQWLRGDAPIAGATGTSYQLGAADLGSRISVRVTATKAGQDPGTSISTATAAVADVAKATSSTKVKVNKAKVKKGKPVRVTATVAAGSTATGTVEIRVDGKVVKRVALRSGKAVATIKIRKTGKHQVTAAYLGSTTVEPSTSVASVVKVR
jgi:hypothetical protein